MSKIEKLIEKVLSGRQISYNEAERIMIFLGFDMEIESSHHVFRKMGYYQTISIKRRSQLLPYQIKILKQVLEYHGYKK